MDLDGLLAPCKPKACELFGIPCEVDNFLTDEAVYEMVGGKKAFWDKVGTHDFFANLGVYSWARELVNMVDKSGVDWIFLTKASRNYGVSSGKCAWVDKWFNKHRNRLWINKGTKSYMSGQNRLLVDDKMSPNGTEWLAAHKDAKFFHWEELHPSETDIAAKRIEEIRILLTEGTN